MSTNLTAWIGRRLAPLLAPGVAVLLASSPALAHRDGAYWHEPEAAANNPQWMLTIQPNKTLAQLSLPGTHDSGTYTGFGGDVAQTQTMSIREQLNSGIRYFDIRVKHYDGVAGKNCNDSHSSANCALHIYHGIVPMGVLFERDVLRPTLQFLKNNPSETVLMRVAMETANCDCDPGPAMDILLAQQTSFDGGASTEKYADYLLPSSCDDPTLLALGPVRPLNTRPLPGSCEARGKLLLMPQFFRLAAKHHYRLYAHIGATTPAFESLRANFDLYGRLWVPVKQHLADAGDVARSSGLYFVGIGGAGASFPYFFASGHASPQTGAARLSTGLVDGITADAGTWPDFPRTNCAAGLCTISYEGMNTLVADYLSRPYFSHPSSRVGIVSADFPGERFIAAVAGVNHGVSFNRPGFGYLLTTVDGRPYASGSWTNGPVLITPRCTVPCSGNRTHVTEDAPNGFAYSMSGAGAVVQFTASPVRLDTTPPTVTAAATTQPTRNGWYTGNVVVRFTCSDTGGSGIASCPEDQILSREVNAASSFKHALDVAGNKSSSSNIVTVKIDKTPPRVSYRGNLGSYAAGQQIDIRCQAVDGESGIATSTCADIRGLAASFGLGGHPFSASATDVAGNTGSGATSFTVVALPGDVNTDGVVDCRDQLIVKASFGKRSGQPGFDARADTNGDAVVDIKDLSFVAQRLPAGTTCP